MTPKEWEQLSTKWEGRIPYLQLVEFCGTHDALMDAVIDHEIPHPIWGQVAMMLQPASILTRRVERLVARLEEKFLK